MTATIIPFPTQGPAPTPASASPTSPRPAVRPDAGAVPPPEALAHAASVRVTPSRPVATPGTAAHATVPAEARPAARTPDPGPDRRARAARPPLGSAPHSSDGLVHQPPPTTPSADQDRLARALDSLRAALAQQSHAIAAWRASLSELHGAATSLHTSLTRHQGALHTLGERVSQLGAVSAAMPGLPAADRTASA